MDKKITILGHVCIDRNVSESSRYESWGSAAMYMARYFSSDDSLQTNIIASWGDDFTQYTDGLDLYPLLSNVSKTMVYENTSVGGKRTQKCYNADIPNPELDDDALTVLGSSDIFILAPLTPSFDSAYMNRAMGSLDQDCLKVLLPQGYFRAIRSDGTVTPQEFADGRAIVEQFDIVIFSEDDYPHAMDLAEEWSYYTTVVMTLGPEGAMIVQAGEREVVAVEEPVPPDKIVDSVGCGDTFSAALIRSYYTERDIHYAVMMGNEAARRKLLTTRE
ncbi:MAG: PfkB family carbohydrate kinase [Candidatus Saccharibacteria bacterium]|nr:PfkB family carbohydrate kinase [Candidatus Saccharibacteria bacterium]